MPADPQRKDEYAFMMVRSTKPYASLPSAEKHIGQLVDQFTKHKDERVLASKIMERIDWGEFNMKEISDAKTNLTRQGIIKEEGLFIIRLW